MNHPARLRLPGSTSRAGTGDWLFPLNGAWPSAASHVLELESEVVRVAVATIKGSAPREPGTTMLVAAGRVIGTIGGGHLEWEGIRAAREMMKNGTATPSARMERFVLATHLGQCCGGVVELWLERLTRADLTLLRSASQAVRDREPVLMTTSLSGGRSTRRVMRASTPAFLPSSLRASAEALLASESSERFYLVRNADNIMLLERLDTPRTPLWIYGAGHVGQSVVRVLEELAFEITWVDSREELLPRSLPPHIHAFHAEVPAQAAAAAPAGVRHLVMTHDHAIDYEICRALLQRGDCGWVGLIGSGSKAARFRSRLLKDCVPEAALERLTCPIGVEGIEGKAPSVIAISVAAQLLQTLSVPTEQRASEPRAELGDEQHEARHEIQRDARHEGQHADQPIELAETLNCSGACADCGSARSAHP